MTAGTTATRQVRIATHGRGMWQTPALAPTAAAVSVSGRILNADGAGVRNAIVTLTDQNGVTRRMLTGSFGYYRFEDVQSGGTYVGAVSSKRYQFAPRTIVVSDEVSDFDFVAN